MKRILLSLLAILLWGNLTAQQALKLMSYNIKNANGMDKVCDYQRIADIILQANPDVVALQEIDSMTLRSKQVYVLEEIAQRCNMNAYYAPAINYKGGKYGIGILAKEKPLKTIQIPLPGSEEARTLLWAEFKNYCFVCTHLSLTEADRMASIPVLASLAEKSHKPLFLAGDMNAKPDSPFIKALTKEFQIISNPKQHTYPSPSPQITIDYIAIYKKHIDIFHTVKAAVLNEPVASDHRPLVVILQESKHAPKD